MQIFVSFILRLYNDMPKVKKRKRHKKEPAKAGSFLILSVCANFNGLRLVAEFDDCYS